MQPSKRDLQLPLSWCLQIVGLAHAAATPKRVLTDHLPDPSGLLFWVRSCEAYCAY